MHYFGVENLTTLMRNLFNTFIGSCLISALRHDLSAGNVFSLRVRERERGRECVCVSEWVVGSFTKNTWNNFLRSKLLRWILSINPSQLSKWSNAMRKTTLVAWTYLTSVLFFLQQVVLKGMFTSQSVRPDIVLKSRQIVSRICQKRSHTSFYLKSALFKIPHKVANFWVSFVWHFVNKFLQKSSIWSHWSQYNILSPYRVLLIRKKMAILC